ncbi:MAG: HlyC/CorC family transporter [Clostridium sp.]
MDDGSIMLIISIAVLILMSAYFSATETAFSSLNRVRLKSMANNGNRRAKQTLALSDDFDNILSTLLIGNNIVNILSASIATILFTTHFGNSGVTISTVVMTILVLIFGEISPKSIAKESPEKFAIFSTPILKGFVIIFTPFNYLFRIWKRLLYKIFKVENRKFITEDELLTIVEEAENDGGIDEHESKLIQSAIEFNDLDAKEILTSRVDLIAISSTASINEIKEVFKNNSFSRIPIFENTIDKIVGVIHQRDFYESIESGNLNIKNIIKPIICVTPNTKISQLLKNFQKDKTHMAVVVDEFGGTKGIVTLEDVLEELVGEIWDEHDEIIEYFKKIDEQKYLVMCSADLKDLFDKFNLGYNDDYESNTVSGWVLEEFGHIPKVGDSFIYENLLVTVTKTNYTRVLEISIEYNSLDYKEDVSRQISC